MSITTICIFTQSPLAKAPRVVKEANVYAEAGYKVTVYGLWYDNELLEHDKCLLHPNIHYKAGIDLLTWNSLQSKKIRLIRKIGRELVKRFNIETMSALGYDFNNYLKKLEGENADLYIGHEEMSMALAEQLIKKGKQVAFDFEDWHSKDLLPKDRAYRPIKLLESLEHYLLTSTLYCYTTSSAMAKAMSQYYKTPVPKVVYNSFAASERQHIDYQFKDREDQNMPSIYWFSQVVSAGRGLELLFEALPLTIIPFQLHLRGMITEDYKEQLFSSLPKHVSLFIHDIVPMEELISRIAEHDLGIAFEETQPESRNYTITNKVFHYLQSGIPILATETFGQLEVAKIASEAVSTVNRNPIEIANRLDDLLKNKGKLQLMKEASWEAGKNIFAFENQSLSLLRMIDNN